MCSDTRQRARGRPGCTRGPREPRPPSFGSALRAQPGGGGGGACGGRTCPLRAPQAGGAPGGCGSRGGRHADHWLLRNCASAVAFEEISCLVAPGASFPESALGLLTSALLPVRAPSSQILRT